MTALPAKVRFPGSLLVGVLCCALWTAGGCSPAPVPMPKVEPVLGLGDSQHLAAVRAVVAPPTGWTAEPEKGGDGHVHQVWISPSGNTAYGVMMFDLPFPVGPDLVLWGFLKEMKNREGEATLLSKQEDRALPGLRFEAVGGAYHLRSNLIVRGWRAWAVYAGTLRQKDVMPVELDLAVRAREHTTVGVENRS